MTRSRFDTASTGNTAPTASPWAPAGARFDGYAFSYAWAWRFS
jgi:hypothetical protein